MTGRERFHKYRWLIRVLILLLKFFPKGVNKWIYDISAPFSGMISVVLRYCVVSRLSDRMGDNVYIGKYCVIKSPEKLEIGNNVSIHDGCYIDAYGGLSIGNDVSIAHMSSLVSFEHVYWNGGNVPIKYQGIEGRRIKIADDVWIGCGVRVLAGATIASKTVVGANSVVKGAVGPGVVVGAPAIKVSEVP